MTRPDSNKVTFQHVDHYLFGDALSGMTGIGKNLATAAGERIVAHGMNHATGALVGYGTEWQRALLITSKHRPNTKGTVVGASTGQGESRSAQIGYEHGHRTNEDEVVAVCTAALESGDPLEIELWDGSLLEGTVTGIENTGLWLNDEWVEGMEVRGATVWSCYDDSGRRDYEIPASRLQR